MDKLITNLDTNLGSVLREQLDTNFQKIQNGVDGQADSLNKQIEKMLGDVPLQDQNEVTQARIDVNGKLYDTLKGREDATQTTAEAALSEERNTSVEVQDARTNSNSKTYSTLKERLDSQENYLDNSFNEKLATMRLSPEAFANEAALRAKYPQGNDQLNVTTDNGHLWIWINGDFKDCGQFQTAGIDQTLVDQINEIFEELNQFPDVIDGKPTPTNGDTVISTTQYLGQEWMKMTSTANTQYRGLAFEIDNPDKISAMSAHPVKINFNIQSSIDQGLSLDIHFYDNNGKPVNNVITIDWISLKASEILNYQNEFLLNSDQIKGVSKVAIWLSTSETNDLGTVLINDYNAVFEYSTNENSNSNSSHKQLPEVYLNGSTSGMSGTNFVTMQFKFKDNEREVDGFASTKWQGDSSLTWDKKAYRIKTFEDQSLTKKMNFKPSPLWDADNKYNLKAYYTDPLLCRDVVNANIGTDLWATQKNMPDDLVKTNDFGFVDGFPVKVFINNKFAGIYSFNTAKGDYGKNAKAVISGEVYSDTTQFKALPTGGVKLDGSDFEMVSPDNPTDEIKQAVNNLITFVTTSSDDDFKTQLGTHIDLESLIDYFIFINVIEDSDADGKNQTLITWDLQKWYFHPYDLDVTYGTEFNGDMLGPSTNLWGLNSRLFTRLNSLFANEIKSRYKELRTWLTPVYVLKMYRDHINLIGESSYEDEFNLWNNPNHDKNNYNFIKVHVYKRFKTLDSFWLQ